MNLHSSTLPDDVILYAYGPVFENPELAILPDFNKLVAEHPWGTTSTFAGLMPVRSSRAGEWLITFHLGLDYLKSDVDHWERDLTVFLEHINQLAGRQGTFLHIDVRQSSNIMQYLDLEPLAGYEYDAAKMVREIHQFATVGVYGPTPGELANPLFFAHMRSNEAEKKKQRHNQQRLARGLGLDVGTGKPLPLIRLIGLARRKPDPETLDFGDWSKIATQLAEFEENVDVEALKELPLGASRIGGLPDLPRGVQWPEYQSKQIPFVAQIRFEDLPAIRGIALPKHGTLYAFYLASNDVDDGAGRPAKVFFYDGPSRDLRRCQRPGDEDMWKDWQGQSIYQLFPITSMTRRKERPSRRKEFLGTLFGEAAMDPDLPGSTADRLFKEGADWIVLLTVCSVGSMLWSDCGFLEVLIRRSDLENCCFDNVLVEIESG